MPRNHNSPPTKLRRLSSATDLLFEDSDIQPSPLKKKLSFRNMRVESQQPLTFTKTVSHLKENLRKRVVKSGNFDDEEQNQ